MAPLISLVGSPLLRHTSHIRSRLAVSLSSRFASSDAGNGGKTALVLGCSGALGNTVSRYLGREMGMRVLGADVVEIPSDFNNGDWDLDGFIAVPNYADCPTVAEVTTELATGVHSLLEEGEALDVVVVASVSSHEYPGILDFGYHSNHLFFWCTFIGRLGWRSKTCDWWLNLGRNPARRTRIWRNNR